MGSKSFVHLISNSMSMAYDDQKSRHPGVDFRRVNPDLKCRKDELLHE